MRAVRWLLVGLVLLLLLVALAVWLLLGNLNSDSIKSRVVKAAADTGLDIDYDGLEISMTDGVRAKRIAIASPLPFREHAPTFVEITDFELSANLVSVALGKRVIDKLHIGSIAIHMVRDETGTTSVDLLFPPGQEVEPPPEPEPGPPKPLSQSLRGLPPVQLKSLSIGSIEGTFIELEKSRPVARKTLSALALKAAVKLDDSGIKGTSLELGAASPTGLVLESFEYPAPGEVNSHKAVFDFAVAVAAPTNDEVSVQTKAAVVRQDLIATVVPVESLVDLDVGVRFQAKEKQVAVDLKKLDVLDQALTLAFQGVLPDAPPEQMRASGKGAGALRLAQLPIEIPGLTLRDADIAFEVGHVALEPEGVSVELSASGGIGHFSGSQAQSTVSADELTLDIAARFERSVGAAKMKVSLSSVDAGDGENEVTVRDFAFELDSGSVAVAEAVPAADQKATARLSIGSAGAQAGASRAALSDLVVSISGKGWIQDAISGKPMNLDVEVPLGEASFSAPGTSAQVRGIRVAAAVRDLLPSQSAPFGVLGSADVNLDATSISSRAGPQRVTIGKLALRAQAPLDASNAKGSIDLASLKVAQRGQPPTDVRGLVLGWSANAPLSLAPGTEGSAAASLDAKVTRVNAGPITGLELPLLDVAVEKKGAQTYAVSLDTTTQRMKLDGRSLPKLTTKLRAEASLAAPKGTVDLEITGPEGPNVVAKFDGGFDRRTSTLRYKASLALSKLERLTEELTAGEGGDAALDVAAEKVSFAANGNLRGLLVARRGQIALAANPVESVRGRQSLELVVDGVRYSADRKRVELPKATVYLASEHGDKGKGTATASMSIGAMNFVSGLDRVEVAGFEHETIASFTEAPTKGTLKIDTKTTIASAEQSFFDGFEIGDFSMVGHAEVEKMRSAALRTLEIYNPKTGTKVSLTGGLERADTGAVAANGAQVTIPGREALTVAGTISQELPALVDWGFAKRAGGDISIPFQVESGDLVSYRLKGALRAKDVSLETTDGKLVISRLSGIIPIVEEVAVLPTGVVLIPGPRRSALAQTRFFDVHPFIDSNNYLTAQKIRFGPHVLGPIAGNIRYARSAFSIDQLQVGYKGGTIAGQVRADYREGDPIVSARLNITGVQPTGRKDRLDANAAFTFVPRTLSLDGKIQIVRIGRAHLMDVLDIIDPFRETASINKVRLGLKVGYPEFVRIKLHDGVLDAKIELGGIAGIVKIDEIRAVPLGPIMQAYVAPAIPFANEETDEETPPVQVEEEAGGGELEEEDL